MKQPNCTEALWLIRDARGIPPTAQHVLCMMIARLPNIQQSIGGLCDDTGYSHATVENAIATLARLNIVLIASGKASGTLNGYSVNWPVLRAIAKPPRVPNPEGPPLPSCEGATVPTLPNPEGPPPSQLGTPLPNWQGERDKEENKGREQPPQTRDPAREGALKGADPAPDPEGPRLPSPVEVIVAAYGDAYLHARGVPATLNGVAHRAATALLATCGLDGALARIRHASLDPWWQSHGDLGVIAAKVDRWATPPRAGPAKAPVNRKQPGVARPKPKPPDTPSDATADAAQLEPTPRTGA